MITVIAATNVDIPGHVHAIERTMAAIPSKFKPQGMLHFLSGPKGVYTWQEFILSRLHEHIRTTWAIIVQADGYAVHPEFWTDEFLEYDYIGAPWKPDIAGNGTLIQTDRTVGNGGFSLRSLQWLRTCASLPPTQEPEDVFCCRIHIELFRTLKLRVAPPELAARFSFEWPVPGLVHDSSKSWGVHGKWNL